MPGLDQNGPKSSFGMNLFVFAQEAEVEVETEAEVEAEETDEETDEETQLIGVIRSIDSETQFTLETGEEIIIDENTKFDNFESVNDLQVGFEVEIEGTVADGTILAIEIEIESETEEQEQEIEIEVEIEEGVANIKAEIDGEEFEFTLEETERETIINAIIDRTGLTEEQVVASLELKVEEEDEESEKQRNESTERVTLCHVPPGNPNKAHTIIVGGPAVEMHLEHGDFIGACSNIEGEGQIEARIAEKQAEREERMAEKRAEREALIAEKQAEREERLAEKQAERETRLAEREAKALERAQTLIERLEQRISQLEDRLQNLLNKVESGEYFGNIPQRDSITNSYTLSVSGTASSLFDESVTSDVSGQVFLENLVTASNTAKFKVTGGEIFVGDNIYDIVFGKARVSSSGTGGEKDSMVLILQTIDSEANRNTVRLNLDFESELVGEFGAEPILFQVLDNSKVSGQWELSATGQLSQVES